MGTTPSRVGPAPATGAGQAQGTEAARLDRLLGANRAPVARGAEVLTTAQKAQDRLDLKPEPSPKAKDNPKSGSRAPVFHTTERATHASGARPAGDAAAPARSEWGGKGPRPTVRKRLAVAAQREAAAAAPEGGGSRSSAKSTSNASSRVRRVSQSIKVTWRENVAGARRRTALVVKGALRLVGTGSGKSEKRQDYMDALPPVLTDAFSEASRERAIAAYGELASFVSAAAAAGAPAAELAARGELVGAALHVVTAGVGAERGGGSSARGGEAAPPSPAAPGSPVSTPLGAAEEALAAASRRFSDAVSANAAADGAAAKLLDASRLMLTHVHAANAAPNPPQPWAPANVLDMFSWQRADAGLDYRFFVSRAEAALEEGKVAIHVNAAGDGMLGRLWARDTDPYALASAWHVPLPADAVAPRQIRGLSVGQRHMLALATAFAELLPGPAQGRTHLAITVDTEQLAAVAADLASHQFYGFDRTRILLLVEPKTPGFVWDYKKRLWEPDPGSERRSLGTGLALKQLGWTNEAMTLSESGKPQPALASDSALGILLGKGVEWLVSSRVGDVRRLLPAEALDLPGLAAAICAGEGGADCCVAVAPTETTHEGAVLRAPHHGKALAPGQCVVLPRLRCHAAETVKQLMAVAAAARGELHAPTERWVWRAAPLAAALGASPTKRPNFVWLPCLLAESSRAAAAAAAGGPPAHPVLYPFLAQADLTTRGGLSCASFKTGASGQRMTTLEGPAECSALLQCAAVQDCHPLFQQLAAALAPPEAPLVMVVTSLAQPRLNVVLFVASEGRMRKVALVAFRLVAQMMLRAGEDVLHLVHITPDPSRVDRDELWADFRPDSNRMLNVQQHVVESGGGGVVADMEKAAASLSAGLVVVASMAATARGQVLGSATVALARRLTVPLLVVKPDAERRVVTMAAAARAEAAPQLAGGGGVSGAARGLVRRLSGGGQPTSAMRVMFSVEPGALGQEALRFVVGLLQPRRDTLVLARAAAVDSSARTAEDNATARMIGSFQDAAGSALEGMRVARRVLQGRGVITLVAGAATERCEVLCMQAPPGQLTPDLVDALVQCRSAFLLFRSSAHASRRVQL